MLQRLPGFTLLTLLFLVLVFLPGYAGVLLFLVEAMLLVWLANREMGSMMGKIGHPVHASLAARAGWLWFFALTLTCASAVHVGSFDLYLGITEPFHFKFGVCAVLTILFLACLPGLAMTYTRGNKIEVGKVLNTAALFAVITLPLSALIPIFMIDHSLSGPISCPLFLYLIAVTKIGDTGAYLAGMSANKISGGRNHRISPLISPNKSWEGAVGGMVACVAMSIWLGGYVFPMISIWMLAGMGLLFFWGGFFGDLAESAVKRAAGVKDSGTLLPGLGGALDFLDALLINAPLFLFFLLLLQMRGVL